MANYSTDSDLTKIRHDILSFGVTSFESDPDLHTEAKRQIDRALDYGWYRDACENGTFLGYDENGQPLYRGSVDWQTYPFNPTLMLNAATQLLRLSCLKVLELAFGYLKKDPEDQFGKFEKDYREQYEAELEEVLKQGVDYDWNKNGSIETNESKQVRQFRTLSRC